MIPTLYNFITSKVIFFAVGIGSGLLIPHLARRTGLYNLFRHANPIDGRGRESGHRTTKDKERTLAILSTALSKELLSDVYFLINNLCDLLKRGHKLRFVLHILIFITSKGSSIESGIKRLKKKYPRLFIPSPDTVLRELHSLSPEEVEEAIQAAIRKMFDILERHRSRKDVNSVLKRVWIAIDITEKRYFGKMANKNQKYEFTRALEFITRSKSHIHNTKDGEATKYLTVSIAVGPLAGLLVYLTPLKVGYSKSEEVDKTITFLSRFMDIELVLMDRGFYSSEVYAVLRSHGVKYLTPAIKTEGVKKELFDGLRLEEAISSIRSIIESANKIATGTYRGKGYKGIACFKSHLSTHLDSLYTVNSVDDIVEWLREFKRMESEVPEPLKKSYKELLQLSETVIRRITEPPRYIIQLMELRGKKTITIVLSLQLNERLLEENLKRKFRTTASRVREFQEQIDFEAVLKRFFLDSYYAFVTPDRAHIDVSKLTEIYKKRWVVETAHKMFHQVFLVTTSNDISIRLMEVLVAVVMYDLWIIHRKNVGPLEEHRYEETLIEFKDRYVDESFLLFEYEEGKCIFVRNGEIVSFDRFMEDMQTTALLVMKAEERESGCICDDGRPPPIGVPVYVVIPRVKGVKARM